MPAHPDLSRAPLEQSPPVVALLLAAGRSSRFGSSKMLALYEGRPLVVHAALNALEQGLEVQVVLGREAVQVRAALEGLPLRFVFNPDFERGMAASIRAGVRALIEHDTQAALIVLGDQPLVPAGVFAGLLERAATSSAAILVPVFRGVRGHPVLFTRAVWPELLALEGDVGARHLLERDPQRVEQVPFDLDPPQDVDTPEDLRRLEG